MPTIVLDLWPVFAMILLGFLLRRGSFLSREFWDGAERLNYFLLFPALLVSSMIRAPFLSPELPTIAMLALLTIAGIWLVLQLLRSIYRWPAERFGVLAQGALRFNTYLGLAAVGALYGEQGLAIAAIIMAIKIPVLNFLSVWALASGQQLSAKQMLRPIMKNPLIQACLLGICLNLSGIGLPLGSDKLLSMMGAGSLPLGLLCVGAALQPAQLLGERKALLISSVTRLLLIPAVVVVLARLLSMQLQAAILVVIFFALPTAPSAYILARQLHGDSGLMAGIITLQTLLAMLSLPLVLGVLVAMGGATA